MNDIAYGPDAGELIRPRTGGQGGGVTWFNRLLGRRGTPPREGGVVNLPAADTDLAMLGADNVPRFQRLDSEIGMLGGGGLSGRARVRSAFSPSQPILDIRMLAGRGEALTTLIRSIEDQRLHTVLYGERGIGKTSLLHILSQLARDARYRVAYHSCSQDEKFSDVFRALAGEVPLLFDARFGPAAAESERGGTLADVLPAGDFSVSQLSEALSNLANIRVLFLLDEFDRSSPGTFRRNIAELIKNLSDRSVRVQLVIAGVSSNLSELIEHIPSIRRNVFGYRVPALETDEVQQLIAIGERMSGLDYGAEARERLVLLANGSPYIASMLAQYAGFAALDRESEEVSAGDVDRAVEQATTELRERLSEATIEAIDAAMENGFEPTLLTLADHAMHAMGALDGDRLPTYLSPERFASVTEQLCDRHKLLAPAFDEREGRYRFREEGIAAYLWLALASKSARLARAVTGKPSRRGAR